MKKNIVESIIVPELKQKIRLSDLPPDLMKSIASKSGLKKAIRNGLIEVNGISGLTSTFLEGGEKIHILQNKTGQNKTTVRLEIDVIFEDDHLAVINKPAGIPVSGFSKFSVQNALPNALLESKLIDGITYPEPIHRLDHPTSGALLIGKTRSAVVELNRIFQQRKIIKKYLSICTGTINGQGTINTPIDGKEAITNYQCVHRKVVNYDTLNLLLIDLLTGRTHQIRKHLSEVDSAILGDNHYGNNNRCNYGKGLFLHSHSLCFTHPFTNSQVNFIAPAPKKFRKLMPDFNFSDLHR